MLLRKNDILEKPMAKPIVKLEDLKLDIRLGDLEIRVISLLSVSPDSGWNVASHSHTDYEFHIIPNGRGHIEIEGEKFCVNEGEFYITGPYIKHTQVSDKDDPMAEYCLECEINVKDACDSDPVSLQESRIIQSVLSKPYPRVFKNGHIAMLFEEVFKEDDERKAGFALKIQVLIIDIVLSLFRSVAEHDHIKYKYAYPKKSVDDLRLIKLVNYVNANYRTDISLSEISKAVFLSPRQINRLMTKQYGQTFHDYLMDHRLATAKRLLEKSSMSIEDIAEESGFSSHYYMYQAFKKAGMDTPANIRKEAR
jgi:AraC-like DNA-binding protein/quercetin dioxygenase-like cupin family protein